MPPVSFPNDETLIRIAGATTFKRAQGYARSGQVEITRETHTTVEAIVTGQDEYGVKLSRLDFEGKSTCTCPAFSRDALCKHVVATTMVARSDAPADATPTDTPAEPPDDDLREFLSRQPAARLAGWLSDLADSDATIEKRLRVFQSQQDPAALRKALSRLLRPPSFLDWRRSRAYALELEPVVDTLASVAVTDAPQGQRLYEYALERLFKIYERSDDSGGDIGEQLRRIAEDYLQLLEVLPAGGADNAKSLLKLQKLDGWGMLSVSQAWALLNDAGRAAYAAAIESEYAGLPLPDKHTGGCTAGSGAVRRMEALAEARGDIDALIKLYSRDLSSAYAYGRIVEVCASAGRHREAQQWAERGLKAYPDTRGMHALLARQLARSGLDAEACEHFWQEFELAPAAESWSELRAASGDGWPAFRERALKHIEDAERRTDDGRRDVSNRVLLLLHDDDVEAARLLAEAQAMSVSALEVLARRIEHSHPESAAGLLRRIVDFELPRAQARHYERLAKMMARICRLAPGRESLDWVQGIRTRYRARRKFLDAVQAALTPRGRDIPGKTSLDSK